MLMMMMMEPFHYIPIPHWSLLLAQLQDCKTRIELRCGRANVLLDAFNFGLPFFPRRRELFAL